jgi:hypothetical protein
MVTVPNYLNVEELRDEIAAWADRSNDKPRGVDWQFNIENARAKLKSLYPKVLS